MIKIIEPLTPEEYEKYYTLRWEELRKPLGKPTGTEKDDLEDNSLHIMAINESKVCVGVCRLQINTPGEGQIRFMAVHHSMHGKGIGKKLIDYCEEKAVEKSVTRIVLHSRETAVAFYQKCGYIVTEKTYLMWDQIQHYKMEKQLF